MDNYKNEAAQRFGNTHAYKEFREKTQNYTEDKWNRAAKGMDTLLAKFAECNRTGYTPDSAESQTLVKELRNHISENYYTCTNQILSGLGVMYTADDHFRHNIDKHGNGTAEFISKAIKIYCK